MLFCHFSKENILKLLLSKLNALSVLGDMVEIDSYLLNLLCIHLNFT